MDPKASVLPTTRQRPTILYVYLVGVTIISDSKNQRAFVCAGQLVEHRIVTVHRSWYIYIIANAPQRQLVNFI